MRNFSTISSMGNLFKVSLLSLTITHKGIKYSTHKGTSRVMTDELLNVKQTAELIGISIRGVRKAIERGALKATRFSGKAWAIKRSDAEAFKVERQATAKK